MRRKTQKLYSHNSKDILDISFIEPALSYRKNYFILSLKFLVCPITSSYTIFVSCWSFQLFSVPLYLHLLRKRTTPKAGAHHHYHHYTPPPPLLLPQANKDKPIKKADCQVQYVRLWVNCFPSLPTLLKSSQSCRYIWHI